MTYTSTVNTVNAFLPAMTMFTPPPPLRSNPGPATGLRNRAISYDNLINKSNAMLVYSMKSPLFLVLLYVWLLFVKTSNYNVAQT